MANKQPQSNASSPSCPNERRSGIAAIEPLPADIVALAANFRSDSKLRALMQDQTISYEMLAVAANGSWTDFAAWLKARGVVMTKGNISDGRNRLRAVCDKLVKNRAAMAAAREEARRQGTTLTAVMLEQGAAGIADVMDAAQEDDPKACAKLLIAGTGTIAKAVAAEAKLESNKLKREDLDLAVQKYQDAAKKGVDKALDEFADVLKKFPKLRAQYVEFRAAVNAAIQEAAA